MSQAIHKNLLLVKCPICKSDLIIGKRKLPNVDDELNLECKNCNSNYSFKNDYLNLLPPNIRKEICTRGILERKIKDTLRVNQLSKNEEDLVKGILASRYMAKQYFKNIKNHCNNIVKIINENNKTTKKN